MGKIYLIRHGETDSNKGHRFQGQMDLPLNGTGLAQARQMVQYMAGKRIDAIYCSSMLRACMTAAELALSKNLAYKPMDLLKEISFGDWEGLEYGEINRRWPREMENFLHRPAEWEPPGGETFAAAQRRCQLSFEQIFAEQGHDKNIAIVSHGGIIRLQLCLALGIPLNNLWRLSVYNVSVSTLSDWQGSLCVDTMNVADFLAGSVEAHVV
ncbi:histidine phosphatase family protein [uncultured Phascolarctobacterium sp.]|uniref:histidine phosphatase family protein n=1 Tax=uncultured Phascolarctobacterium sp. TaxID=512296 RepID=UPI0025F0AF45|nr:histidine phosphatase family protein [uncultured Phascolarctobacterium sp.]